MDWGTATTGYFINSTFTTASQTSYEATVTRTVAGGSTSYAYTGANESGTVDASDAAGTWSITSGAAVLKGSSQADHMLRR